MSSETGGFADKFGNSYESYWLARQYLKLLAEDVDSVLLEPLGVDETGVDVIVESNGHRCFQQCKAGHGNSDSWTIAKLDSAGVIVQVY